MAPVALYDPAEHEPLVATAWDEWRACDVIEAIVADAERAYRDEVFWPKHPRDGDGARAGAYTTLWLGAAGTLWALRHLAPQQAVTLTRGYAGAGAALHSRFVADPAGASASRGSSSARRACFWWRGSSSSATSGRADA